MTQLQHYACYEGKWWLVFLELTGNRHLFASSYIPHVNQTPRARQCWPMHIQWTGWIRCCCKAMARNHLWLCSGNNMDNCTARVATGVYLLWIQGAFNKSWIKKTQWISVIGLLEKETWKKGKHAVKISPYERTVSRGYYDMRMF